MDAKEFIYSNIVSALHKSSLNQHFTTEDVVKLTGQHRNLVSHYLNRLVENKKLKKTTTRPVLYSLTEQQTQNSAIPSSPIDPDIFSDFIGSDGSLLRQIELCKAAVTYPPNGLPILIYGPTGSGKSYLATFIYKYACQKSVIKANSKFINLNCADYANNPELLSDTLFGHKKGAFTGADSDKEGLLDQANGGFLFLDEVHRLSPENQEKLFLFLDQGTFRRLGENSSNLHARVRFIFATSEKEENILLETFQRRVPVKIALPTFLSRPIFERANLINLFFNHEACHLKKELWIPDDVYHSLISFKGMGNIGGIKNLIKVWCAEAFSKQSEQPYIQITNSITADTSQLARKIRDHKPIYKIEPQKNSAPLYNGLRPSKAQNILNSFEKNGNMFLFIKSMRDYFQITLGNTILSSPLFILASDKARNCLNQITHSTGIIFNQEITEAVILISFYYMINLDVNVSKPSENNTFSQRNEKKSKADLVALKLISLVNKQLFQGMLQENDNEKILSLVKVLLRPLIHSENQIHGIIVAHGESTAHSITSVANKLCGGYFFEAFDMPLDSDSDTIIKKVTHHLEGIDTKEGVILLVDMGSLTKLYEPIKGHLQGDLLMINNITTSMAVDIGLKIKSQRPLDEIIEQAKQNYKVEIKYYEGIAMNDNIIISCISGIGIAKKIKKIIHSYCQNDRIELITIDYFKLKDLFQQKQSALFGKTRLIISTTPLSIESVPFINIHELINGKTNDLKKVFSDLMDEHHFYSMLDDIIKLFTIEGAASRLKFLNPTIIINEISDIIQQFEKYYHTHFQSYVRINLFLHISVMIERLMLGEEIREQPHIPLTNEQEQFCKRSDEFFKQIIQKYHINIPDSEKLMILEIINMSLTKNDMG